MALMRKALKKKELNTYNSQFNITKKIIEQHKPDFERIKLIK